MEEGCSLVECLEHKYLDDENDLVDQDLILTNFTGSSPCKMASKRALELIVLNRMNIRSVGDTSRLAGLVQNVAEVDIGWNNITSWENVATILKYLPQLRIFNLCHNPLAKEFDLSLPTVSKVHTVILNGTHLPVKTIKQFLTSMPALQELHLSENDLELGDEDPSIISETAKTIHMNRCGLKQWRDALLFLRRFPNCKSVFLCENPIKTIDHHDITEGLTTLKSLNLGKTELCNWESIDNLDRLPTLTELRLNNIPLLDTYTDEEKHHLLIARVRNLNVLNGSQISYELRETAERFFIRYYQDEDVKPAIYSRLIDKHGQIERLVKVDLTPKTHALVTIVCEETNYTAKLRINLCKSVKQLMKFLEKPSGIQYSRMRLFHASNGCFDEFRYHNMLLHSRYIEDGDQLLIQSKIVLPRRRPLSKGSP